MSFSREEISELIEHLQGTCDTLDGAIQEVLGDDFSSEDLSDENHDQIDLEIFLCADCGWWCEISQESEDSDETERVCDDCMEVR